MGDAAREASGVAVAFGDEDGAGARQMEGGSRKVPRGSRCSLPNGCWQSIEHDVAPAAAQFPILKAVVEQQGVAAEFFDRVTAGFHAVFVHENDDVLEIGREHVGFVAGGFGIEQERFAIGNNARRRACRRGRGVC